MRSPTRQLLDRLNTRTDDQLRQLFVARPDLVTPPAPDLAALATRANTQVSVLRALDGLNTPQLDVLTAAVVATVMNGPSPVHPVPLERLGALLDTDPDLITPITQELATRLLVLDDDGALTVLPAVVRALGHHPAQLGRPAATWGAPAPDVCVTEQDESPRQQVLAQLRAHRLVRGEEDVSHLAAALDALQHAPVAQLPARTSAVYQVLLETHLLVPLQGEARPAAREERLAEHPLEAGLAWRDGTLYPVKGRKFSLHPPVQRQRSLPGLIVNNAAASAVMTLLRDMNRLIEVLNHTGIATLRSGGIGVRQLREVTQLLSSTPDNTTWLIELAAAAGVIFLDPDTSWWEVAPAGRQWQELTRERQWQVLVQGWLASTRAPWVAELDRPAAASASSNAKTTPGRALAPDRNRADAPRLRAQLLRTAAELDAEHPGAPVSDHLVVALRWRSPRVASRTETFTVALAQEAEWLGLLGAGALTSPGRAVAEGDVPAAAEAVAQLLPDPITRVRLQADLTAVAPGYLAPAVAEQLEQIADNEGDGAASVYRFSEDSLRRGLDRGHTAESLLALLAETSDDEIPQSLQYLIHDVARHYDAVRIGSTTSWIRVTDPARLHTLLAHPLVQAAGVQALTDTVAVAPIPQNELAELLSEVGVRAAQQRPPATRRNSISPHLSPHLSSRTSPRAELPFLDTWTAPHQQVSEEELNEYIHQLRTAVVAHSTHEGPEDLIAALRLAATHRQPLILTSADRTGVQHRRELIPLTVSGGRVRCVDPTRDVETVLPLHRIVSADPAPSTSL